MEGGIPAPVQIDQAHIYTLRRGLALLQLLGMGPRTPDTMAKKLALVFTLIALIAAPVAAQGTTSVAVKCGDELRIRVACDQASPIVAQTTQSATAPTPVVVAPPAPGTTRIVVKPGNAGLRVYQALKAAKCDVSWISSALRVAKLDGDSQVPASTNIDVPATCGAQAPANADEIMASLAAYQLRAERDRANLRSLVTVRTDERDKARADLVIRTGERDDARRERDDAQAKLARVGKATHGIAVVLGADPKTGSVTDPNVNLPFIEKKTVSLMEEVARLAADLSLATNLVIALVIAFLVTVGLAVWLARRGGRRQAQP